MTVKAHEVLEAGVKHMQDRAATYDKPAGERSMEATVDAFNVITGDGLMNTEERGWLFMNILKMVRSQQGDFKLDNYEDGAAYWGLAAEAAHKERVTVEWPTEERIEAIGQNGNDGAVYESQCWCEKCNIRTFTLPGTGQTIEVCTMMALCPQCGDKRCERSKHHDNECAYSQPRDLEKPWEWRFGDLAEGVHNGRKFEGRISTTDEDADGKLIFQLVGGMDWIYPSSFKSVVGKSKPVYRDLEKPWEWRIGDYAIMEWQNNVIAGKIIKISENSYEELCFTVDSDDRPYVYSYATSVEARS